MTAMTTAGSRFATLTFFPHTRLIPTQKIRIEPIRDRFDRAVSVIIGLISLARQVIEGQKGYIKASSKPGQGASFFVYLPKSR